jgi:competence ComEA-like helix-hairpin-helix protein
MMRSLKIIALLIIGLAFLLSPKILYAESGMNTSALININDGDAKALSTLPGIGKSTAEKIIKYRSEHGKFKKKEEITNVKGISTKKFEKIKNLIIVSEEPNNQSKQE